MARYQIIREIGRGGMATICEATRHCGDLDQVVAIKRILPELRADESIRARFRQEAEVCMQLAHPNIVRAYDLDADKKKDLIIVMELVDGVSLEKLAGKVELTPPLIRLILAYLVRALAHAHGRGILHRDISPKNILISRNGEVKLADFGLAKRMDSPCTEPGFKGTAAYASPAVVQGGEADVYADLYSLAAVGYWMLTKAPPYFYGPLPQIARRMSQGSIPPLPENAPAELGGLITSLLSYMKERTFHSAEQVEAAVMQHTEPMASPEELATLVRQAMNLDLPADEQLDMERAETRQAASRHPDRADAAHRSPVRQRKQWLAIAAIWLGAVSAAALWMQYGSTQQEPSTGRSGDAPATASMAEEPPAPEAAPEAQKSIAPREARENAVVIDMSRQGECRAPDATDSPPNRQTDSKATQSPSPSSQHIPRTIWITIEPTDTHADQPPARAANTGKRWREARPSSRAASTSRGWKTVQPDEWTGWTPVQRR